MEFELYHDEKGEFRWRLRASNGRIIAACGEGYRNKQDCLNELLMIKQHAAAAMIREITAKP